MTIRDWIGKDKDLLLRGGLGPDWKIVSGVTGGGAGWVRYKGPGGHRSFAWGSDGKIAVAKDINGRVVIN